PSQGPRGGWGGGPRPSRGRWTGRAGARRWRPPRGGRAPVPPHQRRRAGPLALPAGPPGGTSPGSSTGAPRSWADAASLLAARAALRSASGRRGRAFRRAAPAGAGSGRPADPEPPWYLAEHAESPGTWYYYNSQTGETSWEPPAAAPAVAAAPPAEPPWPWVLEEHPEQPGTYFYRNGETGEASWELPEVPDGVSQAAEAVETAEATESSQQTAKSPRRKRARPATATEATAEVSELCNFFTSEMQFSTEEAQDAARRCSEFGAPPIQAMEATLAFLKEELQPGGYLPWADVARRDPRLFATTVEELRPTLDWLEEFLWNQDWAVGGGRQALSDAIQHRPELLYRGVGSLEDTVAWLEQHGLDDEAVREYVAGPTAVPYPAESFPWIELFQVGASGLEAAAAWAEAEMNWTRDEVGRALCREPLFLLTAATAAGTAGGLPRPGYPLPVPRETWLETHLKQA
ncbi:unnamed protein product, partial [Prorocentrum cordatum]